jgi:hypothetical protein
MVSIQMFKALALSFTQTVALPHFEKTSFRVNKKIFATLDESNHIAVVKLSDIDQSTFCAYDKAIIYAVPSKWGKQGWTCVALKKIKKAMLQDILTTAYKCVAPKKLSSTM